MINYLSTFVCLANTVHVAFRRREVVLTNHDRAHAASIAFECRDGRDVPTTTFNLRQRVEIDS
jgi:hypothetical protein